MISCKLVMNKAEVSAVWMDPVVLRKGIHPTNCTEEGKDQDLGLFTLGHHFFLFHLLQASVAATPQERRE